ncbi:MAG: ATP-binding protein [Planctomycetales bacterium]|jgi:PAS domain S-box-containing protein
MTQGRSSDEANRSSGMLVLFGMSVAAGLVFALDVSMELGVAGGVLYVGVVWLALLAHQSWLVWLAAVACTLLTAVGYVASPSGGESWKALTNRGLALFAIWGTAAFSAWLRRRFASNPFDPGNPSHGEWLITGVSTPLERRGPAANFGRTLWIIMGASLAIHVACLILGNTVLSGLHWPHHPVHAAIEMSGGLIAIWVAWMLMMLQRRNLGTSFNVWIAGALIGMGLLDGLHALVHAGQAFVWLHSTATFVGGALFATVWLPRELQKPVSQWWPWTVATSVLAFGILSLACPQYTPEMLVENELGEKVFTLWAQGLNVIGGMLLFVAAARMILEWRATNNVDDLLFCLHCTLFGAAAVMFEQSQLWDLPWWGWHGLRLSAYGVALWFVVLTDRRDARDSRRRAIELSQFSAIIEASDDAIIGKTLDGIVVSWNRGAEGLYGYSSAEMIGQPILRIVPPDRREEVPYLLSRIRLGNHVEHFETVRVCKNGERVNVSLTISPIRNSQGEPVGAAVISRNIAEKKELERLQKRMLEQSQAELRFAHAAAAPSRPLDGADSVGGQRAGIVRQSGMDDSSSVTKSFEEALNGLALQTRLMVGTHQTAISYLPEGGFKTAIHALSLSEKYEAYNSYDVMPTGEGIWRLIVTQGASVRMTQEELESHPMWRNFSDMKDARGLEHPPMRGWLAVPILHDDGRFLGVLQASDKLSGEFDDADLRLFQRLARMIAPSFSLQAANEEVRQHSQELAAAKDSLERSNQDLEQFAYVASHDLQEPLRAVVGYSQLLKKELGDTTGDVESFLTNIVEGGQRMQTLINDLLEYSRVNRKGTPVEASDVGEVVANALRNLDAAIKESGAEIECGWMPTAMIDRRQFTQLFQNLIGNGIKYRGERKPRIEITSKDDSDHWTFTVRDNGIGIAPQFYDQIFIIFKRLHTRNEYAGTGIGLALCKRIVERHGGEIRVESSPGAGTAFHVSIPKNSDNGISEQDRHE